MNVEELKAARVCYLAGQIELLDQQAMAAEKRRTELRVEKDRLIGHLGYDPSYGEMKAST